jgi:hypothetical protein
MAKVSRREFRFNYYCESSRFHDRSFLVTVVATLPVKCGSALSDLVSRKSSVDGRMIADDPWVHLASTRATSSSRTISCRSQCRFPPCGGLPATASANSTPENEEPRTYPVNPAMARDIRHRTVINLSQSQGLAKRQKCLFSRLKRTVRTGVFFAGRDRIKQTIADKRFTIITVHSAL